MLRRILLSSASAIALAGAALAAEPLPPPPPPPPPPLWTGFYAGLNVGYSWSSSNAVRTITGPVFIRPGNAPDPDADDLTLSALSQTGVASVPSDGIVGGGQIGYNWQFGPNWLVGIETDLQGLGQRGHGFFAAFAEESPGEDVANAVVRSEKDVDWLGTLRGRLGWLVTPTLLLYGDGGLAYGGVSGNTNVHAFWTPGTCDAAGCDTWSDAYGSFQNTRVGWTAGGGLEWMFMPNWSIKAEYLYYDLGSVRRLLSPNIAIDNNGAPGLINLVTLSTSSTRFNGSIARVGLNYHFWWPAPVVAKY